VVFELRRHAMPSLVIVRHGQSVWNEKNLFTGWVDVDLSPVGEAEARAAGAQLKREGLWFDTAHTSLLTRAVRTAHLALEASGQVWLPVNRSWRLNERHYGGLQGKDKKATVEQFGAEQVKLWRRSYDVPPPSVELSHEHHPAHDKRYRQLAADALPATECLKDVVARVLPYWHDAVVPQLKAGLSVLMVAHGNSLRALVKHLEGISDADIVELNIPTGQPRLYRFDADLKLTQKPRYLDEAAAQAAAQAVAKQTG
jgi:2,3-bisphosphoglycerate-dependent phosphoglycerate mutase